MSNNHPTLFTESYLGSLQTSVRWSALPPGMDHTSSKVGTGVDAPAALSLVETLGFPKETSALQLAQVLEDIRETPPGKRVERLLRPGVLSQLFCRSSAEASYALAVLSIVESRDLDSILTRLRGD